MTGPIVGLGAGGHAAVMIEAVRAAGLGEPVGLLDADPRKHGTEVLGVPVLGADEMLSELRARGVGRFFNGIGSVRDAGPRRSAFRNAIAAGLNPIDVIHPRASIAPSASWQPGLAALAGAVVGTRARLGRNVIVNTGAIVEHDCVIGDDVHIATGARLAGGVSVGDGAHIGAGATVLQGVVISERAVVGAGAVVTRNVDADQVVVGVPARAFTVLTRGQT